jgi:Tol biopolymer transport system component
MAPEVPILAKRFSHPSRPVRLLKLIAIIGTLGVALLVLTHRRIIYSIPSEAPAHFLTMDSDATDYWPCFSPDGKTVLFSRTRAGGKTWELFVVPTSGGEAHPFTHSRLPVSAIEANWSRHNNLIAFIGTPKNQGGRSGVWLINDDGSEPRQLTSIGLSDSVAYPSWYPDGESLAVVDVAGDVIKRIDRHDGAAVTVTKQKQILAGMPSVSPDGQWIAFAGQTNFGQTYDEGRNSIWLLRNTGELRRLEEPPNQGRTPAWSPDGQWLAFESDREEREGPNDLYAVFIINREGTGLRRVTPYEWDANHPAWSPDGKRLVFSALQTKGRNARGIAIIDVAKPGEKNRSKASHLSSRSSAN